MITDNARRQAQGWNPDRVDPTRTAMLRRAWLADLRRRFAKAKREIMKLVKVEDAFGLVQNIVANCGGKGGTPGPCPDEPSLGAEHESIESAHKEGKKLWKDWAKQLKPHHLAAIDAYQSGEYQGESGGSEGLFGKVRSGQPLSIDEKNKMLRIGYALKGAKAPKDLVVYRGLGGLETSHEVGKVYQDKAHMSTSLSREHVEEAYADPELHSEPTMLRLKVPEGTQAAYLDASGSGKSMGEAEVLLGRGLKYRVSHITRDPQGRKVVHAEVVPDWVQNSIAVINCGGKGGTPGPCKSLHEVKAARHELSHAEIADQVREHFAGKSKAEARASLREFGIVTPPRSKAHAAEMATRKISELKESAERTAEIGAKPQPRESGTALPFDLKERKVSERDPVTLRPLTNAARWQFMASPDQLKQFSEWLKRLLASEVVGRSENELWAKYVQQGFAKGAGRSFDDVKQSRLRKERPDLFLPGQQESLRDFYEGTKQEFLQSAFGRPVAVEKVKLLASRTYEDLKTVAAGMESKIRRALVDGMIAGSHPRDIAQEMAGYVDGGLASAERIARTETTRAHAQGQLLALREMGVDRLGVMVEWAIVDDNAVCPLCKPLDGVVLKMDEAEAMLPRHPNAVFAGSTFASYGDCLELVRAKYSGPCVVLHTAGAGKDRATIGPNHPMMTRRGMVKAAEIVEGDEVLYDLRGDGFSGESFGVQHEQVPLVEDACESAFSICKDSVIAASGSDLHGDRRFCYGEVQAVRPARGLLKMLDPGGVQQLLEFDLSRTDVKKHRVLGRGTGRFRGVRVSLSSPRELCGRHLGLALATTHAGPLEQFSFGPRPQFDSEAFQSEADRSGSHSEIVRDAFGGFSGQVSLPDFFVWKRVHKVSMGWYNGWAFDASTHYSLYCSGGFVVSNCRCAWIPANIDEDAEEEGQKVTKGQIERSLKKSVRLEGGEGASRWLGADRIGAISKSRPESPTGSRK